MSYFSDVVQVKDKDNYVRISIRVSEVRVDEYTLSKAELHPLLETPIPITWGKGVVGVKARPIQRGVVLRFQYGLKSEIHLLSMIDFSILQSQLRSILME